MLNELEPGEGIGGNSEGGGKTGPNDCEEKRAEREGVARHCGVVLHAAEELGEGFFDGFLGASVPAMSVEDEMCIGTGLGADVMDEGV